ncbi:M4 family metallopeptidase [Nocardioides soli]|uniref:Zn-dependent metalloprotease n=1 Tax=Nocardioides soli TaxID=1036020 RepID=A0A7W4VZ81_9ACTN|nr:Zn-dependent metalloprotease [Nocardioides soli]
MSLRHAIVRPVLALAVAAGALAAVGAPAAQAADPVDQALARLDADADRPLTVRGLGKDGTVDFIGVPAKAEVDNPAVTPTTSPGAAADAAIRRYGAAIGAARPGTTLERVSARPTPAGDVARYQQEVDGVPVLGGQVVVSLRADGELSSVLAETSDETSVNDAKVGVDAAAAQARAAFVKVAGPGAGVDVRSEGRWLLDAGLIGGDEAAPARTVWSFEVTRSVDERRMILVDDRTAGVLMNVDLIHHVLDRVVCDNDNLRQPDDIACTPAGAARTEGGPASGVADVNSAFDLSGVVADFYQQVGGFDLTELLGITIGGEKKLASSVNWCYTRASTTCPYNNAFWNGSQMYYGQGYAGADDVVGHEITHGFTERNSGLFYWGQSGAINESISDIMGEIIDHRHGVESDADWALGEDVPAFAPDGLRNLADPTLFGDPDSTSSPLYKTPEGDTYPDNDGVHQNSGVGNKTSYLISQGGSHNGQNITGIDTGDPMLTKSAKLWLLVDQTLTSGSDYADLGTVLGQSCQALLASPGSAFTAADCAEVHKATAATQLSQTPTNNPQPADATIACPSGTAVRVLFDSESGSPAAKMTGTGWDRDTTISHSAGGDWEIGNQTTVGQWPLRTTDAIALPPGQSSFLWFQQWRVLEWESGSFYDAGTVEVDDAGDPAPAVDVASFPWVNGPTDTIANGYNNPAAGRTGFGGDSRGYVASRVDISSLQGTTVRPQFTLNTDSGVGIVGWVLDDITLYTCDPIPLPTTPTTPMPPPATPAISNTKLPIVSGKARVAQTLKVKGGSWTPAAVSLSYQWLRSGKAIGKATKAKYRLTTKDKGKRISVRVTATKSGYTTGSAISKATGKVKAKKPSKKSNKKSKR